MIGGHLGELVASAPTEGEGVTARPAGRLEADQDLAIGAFADQEEGGVDDTASILENSSCRVRRSRDAAVTMRARTAV
ncbi:hypothetical protein ADK54_05195 [Streptomyces sp. WM6378]|nr:hypothetical protein ADK54_05195 [Streptomyces sp. WM6378]